MSVWARIAEFVARAPGSALSNLLEVFRTILEGDPELRRRVAFSVAMIALSAKMAKADGIVSHAEIRAFHEIFSVPREEARNVARLYDLAKQDIAGFETYAERMAGLCGSGRPNCMMLEDILDGLFHIAKADGLVHEQEMAFLHRVAEIFEINDAHFDQIASRHVILGESDPYIVLGLQAATPFEEVRRRYRTLVGENHPDRLIARGVPEEFIAIANARLAAINTAYERIERNRRVHERI
ncbi:DnaJ family molecular chaperone [Aquamicrobium sp. LC103]|uniref:J domain-containing protein n=1 Tax=Aquamicrobium sp. LC103 TaxID=1120658 RepID=UPI00063EA9F0|nr:DnaJ family molecular chaperone [Aquamicrobium sp. LC103]TKT80161.1 DnaJ family molecular chaperone [Aquamicrobium sp. LC103]